MIWALIGVVGHFHRRL